MTRNQIIKAACTLNAADFLNLIEHNGVDFEIMIRHSQDYPVDPNLGLLHIIVEGYQFTESLTFFNGELTD